MYRNGDESTEKTHGAGDGLTHALSVDIEDWTNQMVLKVCGKVFPPTDAVVRNTHRMLDLLEESGVRATFFVLGEVAREFPSLVKRIVGGGHPLGVHGFHHHLLSRLSPDAFGESLLRAKDIVEQTAGQAAHGFRAPEMSLTRETWWAYQHLADAGFLYSSSIRSIGAPFTGVPDAPPTPFEVTLHDGRKLVEIPLTTLKVLGCRIPVAGGGYLRHFPLWFSIQALRKLTLETRSAVVYLHPHELDVKSKLLDVPADLPPAVHQRLKHLAREQFRNRSLTDSKIRALLRAFRFAPLEEAFAEHVPTLPL